MSSGNSCSGTEACRKPCPRDERHPDRSADSQARNPTPPDLRQQVFLRRGIVRLRDRERGRNSSLIRQHIDRVSRRVDRIVRFGQRQFPERLCALRRIQKPNPAKPSRKRRSVHLTQPSKPDPTLSSLNGVRNMSHIYNPNSSQVADKTAFTASPITDKNPNASGWSWSWALGIPASTQKADAAKKFLAWATSKDYAKLVGESEGWVSAPPGTRISTHTNPDYVKAAPFADTTLKAIQVADPAHPTVNPVPYTGVQFVAIPEFQAIGTQVGQEIAAALAGSQTGDQALEKAQTATERAMKAAGYPK